MSLFENKMCNFILHANNPFRITENNELGTIPRCRRKFKSFCTIGFIKNATIKKNTMSRTSNIQPTQNHGNKTVVAKISI